MKRSELVRRLDRIPGFPSPRPETEQVATPPELASELLLEAVARDDLSGRTVLDLGCGTGRLAIGAALLGAASVVGVDADPGALVIARTAADEAEVTVEWEERPVGGGTGPVDTVVMNPPFGAQTKGADRPFWDEALRRGNRIYAFASAASRTFIERRTVEATARIELTRPVVWTLPHAFPHHRRPRVEIPVDLWVVSTGTPNR